MTDELTTIEPIGLDEVYTEFFKCKKCKCDDIMEGHKFCPSCGRKIRITPKDIKNKMWEKEVLNQ